MKFNFYISLWINPFPPGFILLHFILCTGAGEWIYFDFCFYKA